MFQGVGFRVSGFEDFRVSGFQGLGFQGFRMTQMEEQGDNEMKAGLERNTYSYEP